MTNRSDTQKNLELTEDDALYLQWARDIGFDLEIETQPVDTKNKYARSARSQIDNWFGQFYVPVINALWEKHVPKEGACTVLQGEMSRCIGRLEDELFRNGMINMGKGTYLDNMVDKIKYTIFQHGNFSPLVRRVLEMDAMIVKGADYERIVQSWTSIFQQTDVEVSLYRMRMVVAAWCVANPEPIPFSNSGWK